MIKDNLSIWSQLEKTDPKATQPYQNGGQKLTAIKPIWIIKKLTEVFGPAGTGWGTEQPQFQIVDGASDEKLVQCILQCWYQWNGEKRVIFGVGGNKIINHIRGNHQRDEYWNSDDDGFKKAYTDAISNAFKQIGIGADVHSGGFNENKYVANDRKEQAQENPHNRITGQEEPKPKNGMQSIANLKKSGVWSEMMHEISECSSTVSLRKVGEYWYEKMKGEKWPKHWIENAREEFVKQRDYLKHGLVPEDEPLEAAE